MAHSNLPRRWWQAISTLLLSASLLVLLTGFLGLLVWEERRRVLMAEPPGLALEGPAEIMRHRETFLAGLHSLQEHDGPRAVIALRSFTFGGRAAEEYRLYYLANAYQLTGDSQSARRTLARLWQRKPRMVYRNDVGFHLASLYAGMGDWRQAAEVYSSIAARADSSAVEATARADLLRTRFYSGDLGAVVVAARALIVQNPSSPQSRAAVGLTRAVSSIPETASLRLTLEERLRRADQLLRDKEPLRVLSELQDLDPERLGSPARERVLLARGTAASRAGRHLESEELLEPLFSSWYKYAIPALHVSAKNHASLAGADRVLRIKNVTRKVRTGSRQVREKGKLVTKPAYELVTARERVSETSTDEAKQRHKQIYRSRLQDLLDLRLEDDLRREVLARLIPLAEENDEDQTMRSLIQQLVRLEPANDTGLQRVWNQGWAAYEKGQLETAIARFEFIAETYQNPNVRRQAQYWMARAMEKRGDKEQAEAMFESLLRVPYQDLYVLFIEARGHRAPERTETPVSELGEPDWAELAEREMPRELLLGYELTVLGLMRDARLEVQANATHRNRRFADAILADIFHAQNSYELSARYMRRAFPQLATVEQDTVPAHFLEMYYPLRYRDTIETYARERRLDPFLVMALILQESSFRIDARSPVGATGLMQLMPATAREIGEKLYTVFPESRLRHPEVNINLGTYYIAKLIDLMEGDVLLAVAGYNGGPYRIRKWRRESEKPLDEFLEGLPLSETRNYVKRVVMLRSSYQRLHHLLG